MSIKKILCQCLLFLLLVNNCCATSNATDLHLANDESNTINLKTDPLDVQLNIGESGTFKIYLSNKPKKDVLISFSCAGGSCNTFDKNTLPNITLTPDKPFYSITIKAIAAGHDVIEFKFNNKTNSVDDIYDKDSFVRIRIGRSQFLNILGKVFGWLYFVAWSISFWPQNVFNYQRKSVVGLNFDFTLLHWSGFLFYSIFNLTLYFSKKVQDQYEVKFPRSEIPIELNDIVYTIHAALVTTITWAQCFIYEQGGQRVSIYGKLFQLIVWTTGAVLGGLAIFDVITWLTFIYYFSYVKLTVTATKYLPQMIFNIRRKSTAGWSIYMIYLDIVGGSTSMMQMLTIAYNYNDWKTLQGNLPKLGLAIASMFYDVIFLLQEFVFYPNSGKVKPRHSLANLSLRSTFKDAGDDDDSIDEFFRKLSIASIRTSIFQRRASKEPRTHSESEDVVKSADKTTVDFSIQLNVADSAAQNGRSRSLTKSKI